METLPPLADRTLVDHLRKNAHDLEGKYAFQFLETGDIDGVVHRITFRELERRSLAIGAVLAERGEAGDRAILLYAPGNDFIAGFMGCLAAGMIAVSATPPDPSRIQRTLGRLRNIVADCEPRFVVTTADFARQARLLFGMAPELAQLQWIATDEIPASEAERWKPPVRQRTAFLQYTSGSTGTPKGTVITHDNLLHNHALVVKRMRHSRDKSWVSWLPVYHDMGLIGGTLLSINVGMTCTQMPPGAFLQKPLRWLHAISRVRATTSGGPNFGYDLCVRKVTQDDLATLDLSSWEDAFNGAEPVRAHTVDAFYRTFAPVGYRRAAHSPCFGLAEVTLCASFSGKFVEPVQVGVDPKALEAGMVLRAEGPGATTLVGSGYAGIDTTIAIVDPLTLQRCPPDRVGEIWVHSPSVAQGYWRRPEESRETFGATLPDFEGTFLRTGDLGFLLDGELFVTGRLKDLIIIRGRNLYPQDIELTAERCHPALRPGASAAFPLEVDGEELLGIVAEVQPLAAGDPEALAQAAAAVRAAVAAAHDASVHTVAFIEARSLQKTTSGKVMRRATKAALLAGKLKLVGEASVARPAPPPRPAQRPQVGDAFGSWLLGRVAELSGRRPDGLDLDQPLTSLGLDSKDLVGLSGEIGDKLGRNVPTSLIYDYPTTGALLRHLRGEADLGPAGLLADQQEPVAIIGIGCRFPGGVRDPQGFWRLLDEGVDAITEVPPDRWDVDAWYDPDGSVPGKLVTRFGGFLEDIDRFDAGFFGISPREAATVDPQERLLLETTWEALESAGLPPSRLMNSESGVFMGICSAEYQHHALGDPKAIDAYSLLNTTHSGMVGRISYQLGLTGPSVAVDTACSSSLVAVHLACQALRSHECTLALAGGVQLNLTPEPTVYFSRLGVMSPTGRCHTFSDDADGYVRSEGCGVVALKLLADAQRDGDRVLAVIRGTAVNQDGRSAGLAAPSGRAQQAVIRRALAAAGVAPGEVGYHECHGTGTALGDPIEVDAVAAVMKEGRDPARPLVLGTVKSNLGHTEGAAGVAGLIKAALALRHEKIPRTLHFRGPNPRIDWAAIPVRVASEPLPWPREDRPRYATVSSFGFSGTNAHVVLGEAPPAPAAPEVDARDGELIVLSARSEAALAEQAARLAELPEQPLGALAWNLATTREAMEHRLAFVARAPADLRAALAQVAAGAAPEGAVRGRAPGGEAAGVVFVFPGQGSQWLGMGRELYMSEPVFAKAARRLDKAIRAETGWSLLAELVADEAHSRLGEIDVVQPALFAIEVALAELWRSWGVVPAAVVGHSMGEVAAAYVASALSLEDAVAVICRRSKLMRTISGSGEMAVVELSFEQARQAVAGIPELSVAVNNGPRSTVLSGDPAALASLLGRLEAQGVFVRRVQVDVASHSPQVDPLRDRLLQGLAGLQPRPAQVPIFSTVRGEYVDGEALSATYWFDNLREPVRFAEVVGKLVAERPCHFVELSPHPILVPAIKENLAAAGARGAVTGSLRRGLPERPAMLEALGTLFVHGQPVDWTLQHPQGGPRLDLPSYPFQRERYWIDAPKAAGGTRLGGSHPLLGGSITLSTRTSTKIWENTLGRETAGWLADHTVQGAVVLPAAGFVEMALSTHGGAVALEDLELRQALALPAEGELRVQTVLSEPEAGRWRVEISSAPVGTDDWTLHARATLRLFEPDAETVPVPTLAGARDPAEIYAALDAAGLHYGPAFQGIAALAGSDGQAVARLRRTDAVARQASSFRVHPALLDACLQVLAGAAPERAGTWMPVRLGRVELLGDPTACAWCHASLQDEQGALRVTDEAGAVVLRVHGIALRRLSEAETGAESDDWWLAHVFQAASLPAPKVEGGRWLLVGAGDGSDGRILGHALRAALQARGQRVVLAPHTDAAAIAATLAEAFDGAAPTGVVVLAGLEIPELAGDGDLLGACDPVLHLVQGISAMGWRDLPRLYLLTRGAQAAEGAVTRPAQATLLGLGRVVAMEEPALRCTRVDLDPAGRDEDLLVAELLADDAEEEVALRGGRRLVARLVRRPPDAGGGRTEPAAGRPYRLGIDQPGLLDRLVLRLAERRPPGPGEVEIAVEAAGLNFLDVLGALGVMPPEEDGQVNLGGECAGRITAVGEGVEGLAPGQAVMAFAPRAFASHVVVPAALVAPVPAGLSPVEAAALPIAALTAWYALDKVARLEKGERVLIHAATGGVGHAAVQWAQHVGATVFATAGSDSKRARLAELGVAHTSDSRSDAFVRDVLRWTGDGVDVVLNSLSGELLEKSFGLLADHGRMVELGKRDYLAGNALGMAPFLRNLTLSLVDLKGMIRRRPEQVGRLFREMLATGVFTPPPLTTFSVGQAAEAFRTMASARHIGKIVLTMDDVAVPVEVPAEGAELRTDGTWLVTGGFGGLGLALCGWLVDNGVRDLLVVDPAATRPAAVDALEARGARVRHARVDVADRDALAGVLAQEQELRGVFHLAGLLDDGLLQTQDAGRFRRVLGPKALGAWNLHRLLAQREVDHFVLYASAAGLLGSPGQGNYAAANAFLDALAHYRRGRGRAGLSVDWGAFSQVGAAAARDDRAQRLEGRGSASLTPEQGLVALARVLGADRAQVGVVPLDVRQWVEFYPAAAGSSLMGELVAEARAGGRKKAGDAALLAELAGAGAKERLRRLEAFLAEQVSQVLRIPRDRLAHDAPLTSLGMDSLMGLELRNRIEAALGLNLPASVLWTHSTVAALGAHLAGLLAPSVEAPQPSATAQAESAGEVAARRAEAELEDLDAEALAALLEAELRGD